MIGPASRHKDHPDMPDSYSVDITFLSGKKETYEVVSSVIKDLSFEIMMSNGKLRAYNFSSISHVDFDDRFIKIIELKREQERKKARGE